METSQIVDTPDRENLYTNEPLTSIFPLQLGSDIDTTYMRDVAKFVELYSDECVFEHLRCNSDKTEKSLDSCVDRTHRP